MVFTIPNQTDPMANIADVSGQVPLLFPGILLLIYLAIAGAGFYNQQRRSGVGNFPMWSAIASFIVTTGAFILFLYSGIVNKETMVICFTITIISALWFFFNREEGIL